MCRIWQAPPIANVSTAGDPQLLGRLLRLVRTKLVGAQPAEELVHVAEVARDEEHEVEPAVVEVREVEAGAEDPLARVARVADDGAAYDTDLHVGVEQREVDRRLGRRQGVAVLGVEMAVVPDLDVGDPPASLEIRAAEIGDARCAELVEPLERGLGRAQHRPHEMRPAARRGENVREEDALRDLDALLVGQLALPLDGDLVPRRHETGETLGRRVDEVLVAHGAAQVVRELDVDSLCVLAEERDPRGGVAFERAGQLKRRQ